MEHSDQRLTWEIDDRLGNLVGSPIRVWVAYVRPMSAEGDLLSEQIDNQNLILPDGTRTDGDPIFIEGVLRAYQRNIGVVSVELGAPPMNGTANGRINFRGQSAVILPGPASVQLAYPFFVEQIHRDARSYWKDLQLIGAQHELMFD